MTQFLEMIFSKYGTSAIIFAIVCAFSVWGLAHYAAAPNTEVSVLWGLAKYIKREADISRKSQVSTGITADSPSTKISDIDVVAAIRAEALEELKRTKSAPAGLWLMAEATTRGRDDLLHLADQLKSDSRAEALAYLAYVLTILGRPKDALHVAERSLAATDELHESIKQYSLAQLTETFAKAGLEAIALKTAKKTIAQARESGEVKGLWRVVRVLVRISSVNYSKTVAQDVKNPKDRGELLSAIVDELIKLGHDQEAGQVLQEAIAASRQITKASDRAFALATNTRYLLQLKRYDESMKLAKQAKEEAQKIDQNELFGEMTQKLITTRMSLFELTHDELLKMATTYNNPYILIEVVRSMPKRSPDTRNVLKTAQELAVKIGDPIALADISKIMEQKGWPGESAKLAMKATNIALQSNNPRTRRATLRDTTEVLAHTGNFEAAFDAADGIDDIEYSVEAIAKLLSRCYSQKKRPSEKVSKTLSRAYRASKNLEDRDRSKVLMHIAISQAMIGNFAEAYQIAKQAPLSGHRLAAYSIIVFRYELQRTPDIEEKVRSSNGETLMLMLEPIFSWVGLV